MANRIKILANRSLEGIETDANNFLEKLGNTAIYGTPKLIENDEQFILTICYYVPDTVGRGELSAEPKPNSKEPIIIEAEN